MLPSRKMYEINLPEWIEEIHNQCLKEVVVEALYARSDAVRGGAEKHKPCASVLKSADTTMDSIRFGRVSGDTACKKAATAVRKYNTAGECAHPTASTRRGQLPR